MTCFLRNDDDDMSSGFYRITITLHFVRYHDVSLATITVVVELGSP